MAIRKDGYEASFTWIAAVSSRDEKYCSDLTEQVSYLYNLSKQLLHQLGMDTSPDIA